MGDVYRTAEHVLAWLWKEGDDTEAALILLRSLADESLRYGVLPDRPHEAIIRFFNGSLTLQPALRGLSKKISPRRVVLAKFLGQEWFRRLWIVQEVALASQLTLYNGSKTINHQ